MNKTKFTLIAIALIAQLCLAGKADAVFLFDTGTPTGITPSSLGSSQFLAAQFDVATYFRIETIEAWLNEEVGGTLSMVIYGGSVNDVPFGSGLVPNTANEIFAQTFSITGTSVTNEHDWHGLSGLSLQLDPGTYWLALEVRGGQTYDDVIFEGGQTSPIGPEAYLLDVNGSYVRDDVVDLGLRSTGEVVPEPMTVMTLGFSLLGGAALRKKKRV